MNNLQNVIGDYRSFLEQIVTEITEEGFDLSDFVQMDHMCYRVDSLDSYESKKREFTLFGRLLGETQVNGRQIATFRLYEPIRYQQWRIDALELPAPKEGVATKQGLEHIEFVLFDDQESSLKKYAHKQFEMQAAHRGINPEIGFRLPTYMVKFHLLSLTTVLYLEKKLGITDVRN